MKKNLLQNAKILYGIIALLVLVILGVGGIFGYEKYQTYKAEKQAGKIHEIMDTAYYSKDNCEQILSFRADKIDTSRAHFRMSEFNDFKEKCDTAFNIIKQEQTLEFCKSVIKGRKSSFADQYIVLDDFTAVQEQCTGKYFSATFSTGSLFAVENDFKSSVHIKFGLPFYEDVEDINSEAFIENRTDAKKRLINLLEITPSVELTVDDVVLHPTSGSLVLSLMPETSYTFALKSFDSQIEGESVESETFTLTTPKNTYFGLRKLERVSLFRDSSPVDFELISYDTDKTGATVKICRISNEDYAKIEVFQEQKGMREEKKDFFLSGIDKLQAYKCDEKEITFNKEDTEKLKKKVFNFSDLIGEPARSGLYYVTFSDSSERFYNQRVQEAIFFGVIDSHITMKVARDGNAFFFVNDLAGKPLAGQEIRAYANDFIAHEKKWDRKKSEYVFTYNSPLEKSVFDKPVLLGTTNAQGILEVDMKEKIDEAFQKTFSSWNFSWDGNYDSFFVTSASDTNLTYVSSKWNGGISGWNFGYTTGWGWWYGDSQNMNELELSRWDSVEPKLYSHSYTDRKLYLPGEQVHLKSIVRKSKDLSIPNGKQLQMKIRNPKGEESHNFTLTVNEYGSVTRTLELGDEAILGNYSVSILDNNTLIGNTGFSVEVFKNPKFKNEVMLEPVGLNGDIVQNVAEESEVTSWGYERKNYSSNFEIKASVKSDYYSGSPVKDAEFTYKVYKQDYYDTSYWRKCYYGCYWEPEKEFYTEGTGKLDENGTANFSIPVEFSSRYNDYKYIVEVTVTDSAGDTISGVNSLIARLPAEFKRWNPSSGVYFEAEKRFYKAGEKFEISGGLSHGDFTDDYSDEFALIIKKKNYNTTYVKDVRGQERPVTRSSETVEKVLPVDSENFNLIDGKLSLNYELKETGEYIFEFGKIDKRYLTLPNGVTDKQAVFQDIVKRFTRGVSEIDLGVQRVYAPKDGEIWETSSYLSKICEGESQECSSWNIRKKMGCLHKDSDEKNISREAKICEETVNGEYFEMHQIIGIEDILDANSRKYFTLISYGDKNAPNPVESDNKITVLSEKVSYKLGETARVLVRLPYANGKILWTVEKQGVVKHEYIDVPGNTFFKEVKVDDTFVPNAYIGVVVVDTNGEEIPQYKVGYTEIVVDKSDKKSEISIKPNKKTYEPRETVTLDLRASKPSELTVMVVDDSLISLMGNIDANALEKFYKKLPFQIQTSITNIAMLKNYYFSRQGIVGGSGFGNFKGGDSAVSSRNIFKNTAYYNPSVITDARGNARVSFDLPDNLTNFRVMVLGQSKDNFFGYADEMIEVRKDVIVEDRTPLILREGDTITLGANVFNTTAKEIGFKALISADGLEIADKEKLSLIPAGGSEFISWTVKNTKSCPYLQEKCEIPYTISILGDSAKHSDKVEGNIRLKHVPSLITNNHKGVILEAGESADLSLIQGENTDVAKSSYTLTLSNNPLLGIEKIVKSLAVYPFGCGEQLLSSTFPNAVLKRLSGVLLDTGIDAKTIEKNLAHGLGKINEMSLENGAFKYWYHDTQGNAHITAYGVRVLSEIQKAGSKIDTGVLTKAVKYLEENYDELKDYERAESLWAMAQYHGNATSKVLGISDLTAGYNTDTMSRHELIAYTYGLLLADREKYKTTIDANIVKIEKLLESGKKGSYYYSHLGDTGEFTQLLIDYGADKKLITKYIKQMYDRNWESYWYSTKTKTNAFLAFVKYIETYGSDSLSTVAIDLNGNTSERILGKESNTYKAELPLSEVSVYGNVGLTLENVSGATLFANANIKQYPLDALKVKSFSDGVELKRSIYEVVDSSNISEKCNWNKGNRTCSEAAGLKLHSGDTFKKGATYKIILEAKFPKSERRDNLTMEDYLPAGFTILNSNFKTNQIATNQETSDSWRWSHTERNPDVVMAHAKRVWGSSARYEYFVRADFAGDFIYPPAVVYLMYEPDTRANSEFRRVIIK